MACPHGFMKDKDGCEICRCIAHRTEDDGKDKKLNNNILTCGSYTNYHSDKYNLTQVW